MQNCHQRFPGQVWWQNFIIDFPQGLCQQIWKKETKNDLLAPQIFPPTILILSNLEGWKAATKKSSQNSAFVGSRIKKHSFGSSPLIDDKGETFNASKCCCAAFLDCFCGPQNKGNKLAGVAQKIRETKKKREKDFCSIFCFQRCHRPRVNVFRRNCKICTKFLMTFIFRESIDMHRVFVSNKEKNQLPWSHWKSGSAKCKQNANICQSKPKQYKTAEKWDTKKKHKRQKGRHLIYAFGFSTISIAASVLFFFFFENGNKNDAILRLVFTPE